MAEIETGLGVGQQQPVRTVAGGQGGHSFGRAAEPKARHAGEPI